MVLLAIYHGAPHGHTGAPLPNERGTHRYDLSGHWLIYGIRRHGHGQATFGRLGALSVDPPRSTQRRSAAGTILKSLLTTQVLYNVKHLER